MCVLLACYRPVAYLKRAKAEINATEKSNIKQIPIVLPQLLVYLLLYFLHLLLFSLFYTRGRPCVGSACVFNCSLCAVL